MHDCSISIPGTGTSIKSGMAKLVLSVKNYYIEIKIIKKACWTEIKIIKQSVRYNICLMDIL
jgi:hypothetical protein